MALTGLHAPAPTHDWKSWSEPDPGYLPRTYPGDYGRAFIIDVTYPFTGQTNLWDVLLVMPTIDGTSWTMSEVRHGDRPVRSARWG